MANIKAIVVIGRIGEQSKFFDTEEEATHLTHWAGSVDVLEATEKRYFNENDRGVEINDRTDGPMTLTLIPWHRIGEVRYDLGSGRYI